MMTKDIVINSFKRTGNTFLSNAIDLSFFENNVDWEHYRLTSHMHNLFLHRIPQSKDFYQITIVRNPAETIVSAALFDGHYIASDFDSVEAVNFLCNQTSILYNRFYSEWLKNKNSKMIRFEDLIKNINPVLKSIYGDLGLDYTNNISSERVTNNVASSDFNRKESIFTGHVPRGVDSLIEYETLKNTLLKSEIYKESVEIYNNVLGAL